MEDKSKNQTQRTYKVAVLGCRTNQYEAQAYEDQMNALGMREAQAGEKADVCIVNTCTVTENADQKSFYQIRKLQRENPGAKFYVTGCMAERRAEEIQKMEGVTEVVPNRLKESLIQSVFPDVESLPEFSIQRFSDHTRAFVKVQDGCNSFCSYCIIPYVRGRSRSKTIPEIVEEIQQLVANGYKEIVLTGINIGDFDGGKKKRENPDSLADLVRIVDKIEGVERIRISSIDPDEVDDDLLRAVVDSKKTCASMHIVLQAGSNRILKRMNRKYTRQDFFHTVNRLLTAMPDFTFTTDIIVGFPGETEEDFEETLDAIRRVRFSKVHLFPYSERPGTRATRFTDKIAPEIIVERKQKLMRLAEKTAMKLREEYVGTRMLVLTESEDPLRKDHILGHTDNFLSVSLPKDGLQSNELVEVFLKENHPDALLGERCKS